MNCHNLRYVFTHSFYPVVEIKFTYAKQFTVLTTDNFVGLITNFLDLFFKTVACGC